ncbi:hypothetical protein SLS62_009415 [Diatrype stigma]|uniref:Uncharacterized protein n=1 Tax=Diatrype stigma TaxID=117547 RepID=A0AAN9UDB1_9PEZI
MPIECAPLIFPALQHAAADAVKTEGKTEHRSLSTTMILSKAQDASKWTADYFVRRAQAAFAYENPGSTLGKLGHVPQFRSRFANPNAGTNKHLITLVTGGRRQAEPLGARRRWEKARKKEAERRARGLKEKPQ